MRSLTVCQNRLIKELLRVFPFAGCHFNDPDEGHKPNTGKYVKLCQIAILIHRDLCDAPFHCGSSQPTDVSY